MRSLRQDGSHFAGRANRANVVPNRRELTPIFMMAKFGGADLRGAKLSKVSLRGAKLSGVKLSIAQRLRWFCQFGW